LRFVIPPLLFALFGVISDYATTTIGLSMGIYETHPQYNPVWALLVFWGAIAILALTLPREKPRKIGLYGMALASYIGVVNNVLAILRLVL
jgi:hypothetical protein